MKIPFTLLILVFAGAGVVRGQQHKTDSLNALIQTAESDTVKLKYRYELAKSYRHSDPLKALQIAQQVYAAAQAGDHYKTTRSSLGLMANMYSSLGDYTKAMQLQFTLLKLAEKHEDLYYIEQTYNNIGSAYIERNDYATALIYLNKGKKVLEDDLAINPDPDLRTLQLAAYLYENFGHAALYSGDLATAEREFAVVKKFVDRANFPEFLTGYYNDLGMVQSARGNQSQAMLEFQKAIDAAIKLNDVEELDRSYTYIAKMQMRFNQPDAAIASAKTALKYAQQGSYLQHILEISKLLYTLYDQKRDIPAAYQYYKLTNAANDSINSQKKVRELLSLDFDERQRQQDILAAKKEYENTIRTYILISVIVLSLLAAVVFRRNAVRRQKLNLALEKQKEELESTLVQLKQAQKQLIQSEKMAALGQLTTGVAHEMLNPLNFINNFSEVSLELLTELKEEEAQGNKEEVCAIADDLYGNLKKISEHGQRADGIVKGMLEHSRNNSQAREAVNLNALVDEMSNLAEVGFRAKNPSFKADIVKHYTTDLPRINVIPGDFGRVIQNLLNNACYTVMAKAVKNGPEFRPTVTIDTAMHHKFAIVTIKDNGEGIPEAIRDKIWLPFFTTKPTGTGTGLGLSLSYNIIVNGHDGKLEMETEANVFTEFRVMIPVA